MVGGRFFGCMEGGLSLDHIMIEANAKINLFLDVLGRRADGYHDLETIMQSISLCDYLSIKKADGLSLTVNTAEIPSDERNIALRAAQIFFEASGMRSGAAIHLIKHIPVEAGLAGGSADAAGVLVGLNHLYDTAFSTEELCTLGVQLGADVPFCILGGCVLSSGIGEIMKPLPTALRAHLVLCKPSIGVSTARAFAAIDQAPPLHHPSSLPLQEALAKGSVFKAGQHLYNAFAKSAFLKYPQLGALRTHLLEQGAFGAVMTGSGSVVYGLFETEGKAKQAQKALSSYFGDVLFFYATTAKTGVVLDPS